tara:strand:- start:542 stop:670 length:129 start_codon:yes stop_codon:yes gene_type:complete
LEEEEQVQHLLLPQVLLVQIQVLDVLHPLEVEVEVLIVVLLA